MHSQSYESRSFILQTNDPTSLHTERECYKIKGARNQTPSRHIPVSTDADASETSPLMKYIGL